MMGFNLVRLAVAAAFLMRSTASDSISMAPPPPLPTHSRCHKLCPHCTTPDCHCDACWPGQNITSTPDKTCACFKALPLCDPGQDPKFTPGKECPNCWPPENKACVCFGAIGFCEAPYRLPLTSKCKTLCPKCTSPACKCPAGKCWPGFSINHTSDHTCDCFAKLAMCNGTAKPVYTPGVICPSCWPKENHACDCFAALGYCKK